MARHRIDQPLFPEHDGLSFSFYMINHIAPEKDGDLVFKEICKAISKCFESEIPISARLLENYQIYPISSNHTLHQYLNEEAQKQSNFLIFQQKDNSVIVRWFGPFDGSNDIGDTPGKIHRSHVILKEVMEVAMNEGQDEDDSNKAKRKTELVEEYWKNVKDSLAKIEAKKVKLKGFAYQVFDEPTADKLTKQLTASGGKVLVKGVSALVLAEIAEEIGKKIAAMMAAKSAAKVATKSGSSHVSKVAAKSVPVLGLAVGMGFGVWRWWQGDLTGAGLEVMSGAAACLPGAGTATSLAIDAGLIARDVYEAKTLGDKEILELKEEMDELDKGLKDLYDHYDNAMAEYEFVREIVNVGFTVRKLEHETKILDDIVSILESAYEDCVLAAGSPVVSSSV